MWVHDSVMRRLLPLLVLFCLLVCASTAVARTTGPCVDGETNGPRCSIWEGRVQWVDDGDTLHVKVGSRSWHVRVTGINAQELTDYNSRHRAGECHAVEAADRLDQLVKAAKGRVRLTAQDVRSNSHGRQRRSVAVKLGGRWRDVGRTLLAEGLALWMPNRTEWAWNPRYSVLAEQAAAAHVGIWNTSACGPGPDDGHPLKLWVNWQSDGTGSPDGEWARLRNLDAVNPLPLGGWALRDAMRRQYRFPSGTVLAPGGVLTVHVGEGIRDDANLYWGLDKPVFDNVDRSRESGDGAYLFDPQGDLRAWMVYPCRTTCGDPNLGMLELGVSPRGNEFVSVRNTGPAPIGMEGYRLTSGAHTYAFESDAVLQPGESLRVYTTRDSDRDQPLIKGWSQIFGILRDKGGDVRLSTFTDSVLACVAWGDGTCAGASNR
ncbi:hypothetical protein DSM104329_05201 [Capillimicrobium parvum]|uniref:Uncharacterized protein n=2 Tax=Capillimicrobium parvum TaxID=2884022 RepID=A0A9E6Y2Q1_9ACTN|nr:hypothetical protein DSM104329_05201 [Capillimicrobium parvum]